MSKANGEGAIRHRADGRWEVRWTEHGRRRSAYAKPKPGKKSATEADAKSLLRSVLRRIDDGQTGFDSRMKFRDYAKAWREQALPHARDRRGRALSSGTKRVYGDVMQLHVEPVIGDLPVGSICEADVERVLRMMSVKGLSGSYQGQAHKTMARAFRDAKKMRLIAVVPMQDVPAPSEVHAKKVVPTAAQIRLILEAAPDQRLRCFVAGLAFTGLRIAELLSVKWSDVDLKNGSIHVMGKGSRPRTVPIAPALKTELKVWKRKQATERLKSAWWDVEGDWLLSSDCGTQWDTHNARKRFKPFASKVCPGITPHSLRHATATMLLEEHVPMKVVAELLGHSSTRITESTYSHVTEKLVTESTDALQRRIGG